MISAANFRAGTLLLAFGLFSAAMPVASRAAEPAHEQAKTKAKAVAPRTVHAPVPRTNRAVTPHDNRTVTPRAHVTATPHNRIVSTKPKTTPLVLAKPKTKPLVLNKPNTTPLVLHKKGAATATRVAKQRVPLRHLRAVPTNLAVLNKGFRQNPGHNKPAAVAFNPAHKAAQSGWRHSYKPFFFRHGGHRWHRVYYTFLFGGLWYWYWYDDAADSDPQALVYSLDVLPDCDPDADECAEIET